MYPIPANATRIRYLESTGTQIIDTGIGGGNGYVSFDLQVTNNDTTKSASLFGGVYLGSNANGYDRLLLQYAPNQSKYMLYHKTSGPNTVDWQVSNAEKYAGPKITQSKIAYELNSQFAQHIGIFGRYNNDGSSASTNAPNGQLRLFSFRLWDSQDTLVRSYIPVRVGSTGELFDRVTGTYATRVGDFVLGPDTFATGVLPTRMMPMGVKRKPYDAQVEYIESTGTQYVDTGVIVSSIGHVSVDLEFTTNVSNQGILGSEARSGSSNAQKERFYGLVSTSEGAVSGGYIDFGNMTNSRLLATSAATGMRLVVDHDVNVPSSTKTDGATIYIFAVSNQNGTGPTGSKAQFKLRYLRVLDKSSVLIRDFIPVRKGTTGYLYDKVSKQLFGNAGTGSFTLGPDK